MCYWNWGVLGKGVLQEGCEKGTLGEWGIFVFVVAFGGC